MTKLKFNDLFKTNTDGTFNNKVKLRIGESKIHNMTIGSDMNLPQFNTKLSEVKNSTFHVEIDKDGFYNIKSIV